MSITEILPEVSSLSSAEKFRLVQLLLEQLAKEGTVEQKKQLAGQPFNPREFFGAAQASKQEIDMYLQDSRAGWN